MEEWKPMIGYEEYLMVSSFGAIRNIKTGTSYKFSDNGRGYYTTYIKINGKSFTIRPHREVAKHFVPNPNNLPIANHKDGNKKNNRADNLEWVSISENTKHAYSVWV